MHVGWMAVLDLPRGERGLDAALLRERIGGRLHLTPRFRQRVVQVPMRVSEPVWQDVPDFDLDRHVSAVGDESELDRAAMRSIADAFFSEQLDRSRPLWHILVVPRLIGGRAAVLGKVHHAMVDGIAAVELGMLMFDGIPEPEPAAPVGGPRDGSPDPCASPWAPSPTPRWTSSAWRGARSRSRGRPRTPCAWPTPCAAPRCRWPRCPASGGGLLPERSDRPAAHACDPPGAPVPDARPEAAPRCHAERHHARGVRRDAAALRRKARATSRGTCA